MTRKCFNRLAMFVTAIVLVGAPSRPAAAQGAAAPAAAAQDQSKTTYTLPEYNAFQAANSEKDPQARLKLLDDFVAKYPNSTLMPYVDTLYYQTYSQLKNYPKTIEWADKLVALGDKVDAQTRLQAIQARVAVFTATYSTIPKTDLPAQLTKERDASLEGASLLDQLPKPALCNGDGRRLEKAEDAGARFFLCGRRICGSSVEGFSRRRAGVQECAGEQAG